MRIDVYYDHRELVGIGWRRKVEITRFLSGEINRYKTVIIRWIM